MDHLLRCKEPKTREEVGILLHEVVDLLMRMPAKMADINMAEPESMLHEDFADCQPTSLVEMFIFALFIVVQEKGEVASVALHDALRDFMAAHNHRLPRPEILDAENEDWPELISPVDH